MGKKAELQGGGPAGSKATCTWAKCARSFPAQGHKHRERQQKEGEEGRAFEVEAPSEQGLSRMNRELLELREETDWTGQPQRAIHHAADAHHRVGLA